MESSIFIAELTRLDIGDIRSFCNQGFAEGLRLEYKRDFPENLKLAETICAFANTEGGIILIGVEADTDKNKPKDVQGIRLKDGLEEKVINICLSHISPTIAPEVKVCDFKSDLNKSISDRAVVFIRVRSSYNAPHYILDNNWIVIRIHNRNSLADLRTIESLIDRRESFKSTSHSSDVLYDLKKINVENEPFETVVVAPQFQTNPIIYFYNKEESDWLFGIANEVMRLNEQRPDKWRLDFVGLNPQREITRYCGIGRMGKISLQTSSTVDKNRFFPYASIQLIIKALEVAKKIYSHFGFYGDLVVGITIVNTQNLLLALTNRRLLEEYRCTDTMIHISKELRYDELSHSHKMIEEIFKELCVLFGLVLPEKTVVEIVKEIFKTTS